MAERVFVARIPQDVTEDEFKRYFESFGTLHDAYMPKDHITRRHRGIGFLEFEEGQDPVEDVISSTHVLGGQEVAVDRAAPKEESNAQIPGPKESQAKLKNGVNKGRKSTGGPANGSGSVNGPTQVNGKNVQSLVQASGNAAPPPSNGSHLNGVTTQHHHQQGQPSAKLFVRIPHGMNEEHLRAYFSQFGRLVDVYIPKMASKRSAHRGFGFVTYESERVADEVASQPTHQIGSASVRVDRAVPKKESLEAPSWGPSWGPFCKDTSPASSPPSNTNPVNSPFHHSPSAPVLDGDTTSWLARRVASSLDLSSSTLQHPSPPPPSPPGPSAQEDPLTRQSHLFTHHHHNNQQQQSVASSWSPFGSPTASESDVPPFSPPWSASQLFSQPPAARELSFRPGGTLWSDNAMPNGFR